MHTLVSFFDNKHKIIKCHPKIYVTKYDKLGTQMAFFEAKK